MEVNSSFLWVKAMKLRKDDYDKFAAAFNKRYKDMIKTDRKPTETEMVSLYAQFKSSGKKPDQWLLQQEQT